MCWFYGGGQLRSPWGFNCWQPILCYGKDPSLAQGRGARPDAVNLNTPANAGDIDHPCPKPVKLWAWLVERLTFERGAVIADPFGGSGTTLIAAAQLGRVARLIELDPRYCDVIRRRWTRWAIEHGQEPGPGALDG
jgi:DNA modification methylase